MKVALGGKGDVELARHQDGLRMLPVTGSEDPNKYERHYLSQLQANFD